MSRADEGRLIHLAIQREREKEDIEMQKKKIEDDLQKTINSGITEKFTANYDAIEENLKSSTIGLVTLDEMKMKQKDMVFERESEIARAVGEKMRKAIQAEKEKQKRDLEEPTNRPLSFAMDEDDDEEEVIVVKKRRIGMDPTVDTSFLPDSDRDRELAKKKEDLAREWQRQQEREKNEDIVVSYGFWDGSSHPRTMRVKKGVTIGQFLGKAIDALKKEFTELKTVNSEALMFVKEDLIIPHFYTFQDFIVAKAMGKTGPLYVFETAGEVRLRQDAALCGEAHPVKVVLRSWYEKNKHIYPASRWEAFVPNKQYGKTIDDLATI